ncbi:MAG: hypothetical protein K9G70_10335 [Prolixibacteraceae bacterium]|nr:hypothetical protein [Prolixibacteraceae bacterium]
MKKLLLNLVVLFTLIGFSQFAYCQEPEDSEPYILSLVPDSLTSHYDYSHNQFVTVSIRSRFGSDPTERAIQDLEEKIIELCKTNEMDAFILKEIVFAKPFDEGKLIGYGTMIRLKSKKTK